jgi:palmitoyltransferase ZDHHC6
MEKRARTRQYRIISKVSGSWMPLWSQGCRVCINPPLTDEARIPLDVGDVVNVTRWRTHWLFGEKVENQIDTNEEDKQKSNGKTSNQQLDKSNILAAKRIRGWFPRKCAVEFYEDNDEYSDDDEEIELIDTKKKSS